MSTFNSPRHALYYLRRKCGYTIDIEAKTYYGGFSISHDRQETHKEAWVMVNQRWSGITYRPPLKPYGYRGFISPPKGSVMKTRGASGFRSIEISVAQLNDS